MLFYHAFYLGAFVFNMPWAIKAIYFFMPSEPLLAGTFIFVAGISSQLSKNNFYRGVKIFVVALAISLCTAIFMPTQTIRFGVLHFLSVSMMIYGLAKKAIDKIPSWVLFVGGILLFVLTYGIWQGRQYIGLPFVESLQIPISYTHIEWLYPFGFRSVNFSSADYFPLIPWFFLYCVGTVVGRYVAAGKVPKFLYVKRIPALSWVGRHALAFYIVHQPIFYVIFSIITYFTAK